MIGRLGNVSALGHDERPVIEHGIKVKRNKKTPGAGKNFGAIESGQVKSLAIEPVFPRLVAVGALKIQKHPKRESVALEQT